MPDVLRKQFAKGSVGRLDLAEPEAQLAQAAARLPPMLKQLAQQRDLLVALSDGLPKEDLIEKFESSGLE